MKKLGIVLVALCFAAGAAAQTPVKPFEFEIGAGISFGGNLSEGIRPGSNVCLVAEPRYNLRYLPLTVGFQIGISNYSRDYPGGKTDYNQQTYQAVCDANLYLGRAATLFAGIGLGLASVGYDYKPDAAAEKGYGDRENRFVFMPRVGVELLNGHLRLSFDYKTIKREYSRWAFTVGLVFGGGSTGRR